jgi:hypothetical protein
MSNPTHVCIIPLTAAAATAADADAAEKRLASFS